VLGRYDSVSIEEAFQIPQMFKLLVGGVCIYLKYQMVSRNMLSFYDTSLLVKQ
jgi:hypothetical protein